MKDLNDLQRRLDEGHGGDVLAQVPALIAEVRALRTAVAEWRAARAEEREAKRETQAAVDRAVGDLVGLEDALLLTGTKLERWIAADFRLIRQLRDEVCAREEARAAAVAEAVALRKKLDDERALTKRLTEQREEWAARNVALEAALAEAQCNERVAWDAAGDLRYQGEITALLAERDEQARLASERLAEVERLRALRCDCDEEAGQHDGRCVTQLPGIIDGMGIEIERLRAELEGNYLYQRCASLADEKIAMRAERDQAEGERNVLYSAIERVQSATQVGYSARAIADRALATIAEMQAPCPGRHDVTGGEVACTLLDGHDGEHRYAAPSESEAMKDARDEMEERQADASERGVENRPPSAFARLKAPANLAEIVAEVADDARAAAVERTKAYRSARRPDDAVRYCSCLGTCRGAEGLSENWHCAISGLRGCVKAVTTRCPTHGADCPDNDDPDLLPEEIDP